MLKIKFIITLLVVKYTIIYIKKTLLILLKRVFHKLLKILSCSFTLCMDVVGPR